MKLMQAVGFILLGSVAMFYMACYIFPIYMYLIAFVGTIMIGYGSDDVGR